MAIGKLSLVLSAQPVFSCFSFSVTNFSQWSLPWFVLATARANDTGAVSGSQQFSYDPINFWGPPLGTDGTNSCCIWCGVVWCGVVWGVRILDC